MKKLILLSLLMVSGMTFASEQPDHSIFDRFLNKYVSSTGKVNYKGMKTQMDSLDAYITELRGTFPSSDWGRNAKKAYYCNAYNAYTLKLVLVKYPLNSVKDASFSGKDLWSVKLVKLGDKTFTLAHVENEILRKMKDPRIHFAINCASYSCPRIWNHAFTEENISSRMTKLTKEYINNPKHNTITPKKIKISKIFDWYSTDFVKDDQTLIQYLNKYSKVQIESTAKIEYLPYNWSLNE
tara:strand:- start:14825 stop:15541 length:717 start_codon:yes stop_codon:yes gene_type:complete